MKCIIKDVQTISVIAWYLMLASMASGSNSLECSCYTFYGNISDWSDSRKVCRSGGGDLVSMETLSEWEFIKTHMQNRTTSSGHDQWWIGLVRKTGQWRWLNGHNLTYDKWKPGLELNSHSQIHVIMEKNQGILWNLYWYQKMGSICEENGAVCNANQERWCDTVTTTTTPTTIVRDTITEDKETLQDVVPNPTTQEPTVGFTNAMQTATPAMTTNTTSEDDNEVASNKTEKPFPVLIIIIVLIGVLLVVCIIILIVVCACRKKRQNKEEEEQEKFMLQPVTQTRETSPEEPPCIYATVDKTRKTKPPTEPEYAELNSGDKADEDRPQELTYAELTDFTTNEAQPVKMPPPYEPTEYATVTV